MAHTTRLTLVLLRHGQSTWNERNLFTGWVDVGLTARGEEEARRSGHLLVTEGVAPDIVHTSVQQRAIRTAELALEECDRQWIPVRRSWRLNERHYGDLTGLDKAETAQRFGEEQVHVWRRSYDTRPPDMELGHEHDPSRDPRYANLDPVAIPRSECLADVVRRLLPWWEDAIVADLRAGLTVLVSAHGNSLRALVKHLDQIPDHRISELNIPTGVPLVYELDPESLRPIRPADSSSGPLGGRYLDPEAAETGAAESAEAAKQASA
jgi:2,3-bisphosphoglycerate-dependent phosphoglycerate mutase